MKTPIIHLTPPQFSPEHIQEKIICIRGHRERIFRIQAGIENGKLICHNYGQGGAGWTFLFGSVHHSIRQFEQQLNEHPAYKNKPITVIGAGCYGLLTALLLKRMGFEVRIIAKETGNSLASHKAAGFFFPRPRKSSTPDEIAQFHAVGLESYTTYQQIIAGEHPFLTQGPKLVPAYYDPTIDPGFAPYIEHKLIDSPRAVTIDFGNSKQYNVMEYQVIFIDSAQLFNELQQQINAHALPIIEQELATVQEIDDPIVFNCSGLGAKKLTPDPRIVPVQGHLITLKNQADMAQLQYLINVKVNRLPTDTYKRDELIYYTPKQSGILGITFLRGQDSLTNNQHEFDKLLERCGQFFGV